MPIGNIKLETKRLILREFHEDDAPFFFELNNDPIVMKYTGDVPFATVNDALDLIRNYDQYEKYGLGRWTVVLKKTMEPIGWCGLKKEEGTIDLGYRFLRKCWNRGYATEAAQACLKWGEKHSLLPILGRTHPKNLASIRLLEKCGFTFKEVNTYLDMEGTNVYIYEGSSGKTT